MGIEYFLRDTVVRDGIHLGKFVGGERYQMHPEAIALFLNTRQGHPMVIQSDSGPELDDTYETGLELCSWEQSKEVCIEAIKQKRDKLLYA